MTPTRANSLAESQRDCSVVARREFTDGAGIRWPV
jgi:hypothetical protein